MTTSSAELARVDEENNVFAIEDGVERKVGQYPGVSAEEALAYFERKFADLLAQVRLLEQRVAAKADPVGLKKALTKLGADLVEPAAVGDFTDLRRRLSNLNEKISLVAAEKQEANKEVVLAELAARAALADKAEAIAGQETSKIQWKNSSAEMTSLFEQWQTSQKSGPKLPKSEADAIWKRFSVARTKFESAKRQYFAALDVSNKAVKAKKNEIVSQAEALVQKGADAISEYRKLLDDWKVSGRSNGKSDDELWARFKAAGDAIYAAKSEVVAIESGEQSANLAAKLELLAEAAKIDPAKDLTAAKKLLQSIQQRWEKVGRVPKDKLRETEDKLRAIEATVRKVEEDNWRKTDPTAIDRSNSVLSQLHDSIAKLEAELEVAKTSKDKKAIDSASEALETRKAWLEVVKQSAN